MFPYIYTFERSNGGCGPWHGISSPISLTQNSVRITKEFCGIDVLQLMPLVRQNEFGQWRANFQYAGGGGGWEIAAGRMRTIASMREQRRDAILFSMQ
jgi:hypothetical protein